MLSSLISNILGKYSKYLCLDKQLGSAQVNFSQAQKTIKIWESLAFYNKKSIYQNYGERFGDILILIWLDVN